MLGQKNINSNHHHHNDGGETKRTGAGHVVAAAQASLLKTDLHHASRHHTSLHHPSEVSGRVKDVCQRLSAEWSMTQGRSAVVVVVVGVDVVCVVVVVVGVVFVDVVVVGGGVVFVDDDVFVVRVLVRTNVVVGVFVVRVVDVFVVRVCCCC